MSLQKNEDGTLTISRATVALLSIIVVLVGSLVTMGISWGSLLSNVTTHHNDTNLHHSLASLDDRYVRCVDMDKALTRLDNAIAKLDQSVRDLEVRSGGHQ